MCHACEILIGGEEITEENWALCRDYIKMYHGEIYMKFIKRQFIKRQVSIAGFFEHGTEALGCIKQRIC